MRKLKRVLSVALALCMLLSLVVVSSSAATDYEITLPTEAMDTEGSNVLTTLAQRASSEIPLIFGLNVIGGNMFSGLQDVGGTSVNENPDPYVWNYNYLRNVLGLDAGTGVMSSLTAAQLAAQELLPEGTYYVPLGNTLTNSNGLYSSGGANQSYGVAVDELGGAGYAVGYRTDVIIGFNSNIVDQIEWVQSLVEGDEYYEEGDEDYSPLIIDVQTGSVTSRLYAWTEMGQAISAYLEEHEDLTTRYDDPYAIAVDVEEFSAGIPYYIASLIADGTIEKKTAAYVSNISDNLFTCVDPGTVGNVGADVYAEVNNFNFIEGTGLSLTDLMEMDVDVIILGASGYSYNGSTTTGGASGSTQGSAGDKADILVELADLGYSSDEVPLVMDSNTISVQIGTNGYNYSPITPMFVPYVQVYAYMEELAEINPAINPAAMVEFMFNELCHVSDNSSRDVALYYIGSNWDAVDDEYDTVPDIENYIYNEYAIIEAINVGIEYAMSDEAEANGNTLLAAYRTSDNAYIILTQYLTTSMDLTNYVESDYIELVDTGDALGGGENVVYYLNTTALYNAATTSTESDMSTNESGSTSQFQDVDTSYAQIITYYNSGEYGYGDDLQTTLQNYLSHMVEHVWDPSDLLSVEGTYGYSEASVFTDVNSDAYYATALDWAYDYGITTGTTATTFSPSASCTRAQFVTFLWRLAGEPEVDDEDTNFTDLNSARYWYTAVLWAEDMGYALGTTTTTFSPNATITRAQAVTFLWRVAGKPEVADENTDFTDLDSARYWYTAVLWAEDVGVVAGMTDTTFVPNTNCNRAMMVTFLYRYCKTTTMYK